MSRRAVTVLCVAAGLAGFTCLAAMAQSGGSGGYNSAPDSRIVVHPDTMDSERFLRENVYTKPHTQQVKNLLPSKEDAVKQVAALLDAAHLSCVVTDAALVARGSSEGGAPVRTFEASCANGLGYFVVSAEATDAFSCFAAEDTYRRDVEAGRQPGIVCGLPANKDAVAMAAAALTQLGMRCQVTQTRWIGLSAKAGTEYTEVACSGSAGYVLTNPVPGSPAPVGAMTCIEAGKRGIACKLSPDGQPRITLQTFRDALAAHAVTCTAADDGMRVIGQETAKKRHVVEFRCAEHPKGLVAFIPLEGNTTPFEAIDCGAAAKRQIACALQ